MRATIEIDDELLVEARKYSGLTDIAALVHEALTMLIQREAARRLAQRGFPGAAGGPVPAGRRRALPTLGVIFAELIEINRFNLDDK